MIPLDVCEFVFLVVATNLRDAVDALGAALARHIKVVVFLFHLIILLIVLYDSINV